MMYNELHDIKLPSTLYLWKLKVTPDILYNELYDIQLFTVSLKHSVTPGVKLLVTLVTPDVSGADQWPWWCPLLVHFTLSRSRLCHWLPQLSSLAADRAAPANVTTLLCNSCGTGPVTRQNLTEMKLKRRRDLRWRCCSCTHSHIANSADLNSFREETNWSCSRLLGNYHFNDIIMGQIHKETCIVV